MVDAGEIFHPLRWTPGEAIAASERCPATGSAGVVVRMPAAWRGNRPPRPQVTAHVGGKPPSGLGQDALLDFQMEVTLDGETLTAAEIRELLAKSDGLALVRGRWVEVDREQLNRMMEHFREVERTAAENGLGFRRSHASAGRRRCPQPATLPRMHARVGAGGRRSVARGDAEGTSQPGRIGPSRPRRCAEGDAAAVSAGGRALALSARETRPRGLPGGRHGTRQDHPGAFAAAGAQAPDGRSSRGQACWSPPLRCWPTGRRRSNASRLA